MPGTYDLDEAALSPGLDSSLGLSLGLNANLDSDLDLDLGADDREDPRAVFDDEEFDDTLDGDADDEEHRVAHRPNPLPSREEDEEDLAEADMHEGLDLDDRDRALRDG